MVRLERETITADGSCSCFAATINLDPYTAFVSTFTTEHGIELDEL